MESATEAGDARDQGSWAELFRGTYLRRTVVASLLLWIQQTAGAQFVNSYGPTFFKQMGCGDRSFTYSFLATVAGFIAALFGSMCSAVCTNMSRFADNSDGPVLVVDKVGRRPLMISGMLFAGLFDFVIAGLGTKENLSKGETNAVIASLILLNASCKYSASLMAYLIASEVGGIRMRKKSRVHHLERFGKNSKLTTCPHTHPVTAFATGIDVLSAFVITFCIPYLLGTPGANLGAGVGWILGGDSCLGFLFALFFVPDLTGRSLEEVDELFEARLWAWQFRGHETTGIRHRIALLEERDGKAAAGGKSTLDDEVVGHDMVRRKSPPTLQQIVTGQTT